jgi:hypothetical protein
LDVLDVLGSFGDEGGDLVNRNFGKVEEDCGNE